MAKARKQKKQQQESNKLQWANVGRWVLGAMLFLVMGSGAAWGVLKLQQPDVLPLKVVRIDGEFKHLDRRVLEEAVGKVVLGNFFTLDVDAVRQVATDLPWVERVSVRRVWPDTLQMWVVEQVPLGHWGKDALVNAQGKIFKPEGAGKLAGLPYLNGPDETAKVLTQRYQQLREQFGVLGLGVERIDMDARRALSLKFAQGLELQIGSVDVNARVARFISTYPYLDKRAGEQQLKRVDLRYANGLSVYGEQRPAASLESIEQQDVLKKRGQV